MAGPKIIKLFLASSSELAEDRREFEIFINRKNKTLIKDNTFIELEIWEDFLDSMSRTRLQDEYNKAIRNCDLFVMLFFTKVGKYTLEEFETAFGQFKETSKPLIFTYFKDATINTGDINRSDVNSLLDFQDKLKELGHFWTKYKNIEDLKYKFSEQLEKLKTEGYFQASPVDDASEEAVTIHRAKMERSYVDANSSKPSKTSFYIPAAPGYFIGREKLLDDLHDKLKDCGQLLLVNGMGGIGKTAVAQAYINTSKYAGEYKRVAWVSVTGSLRQDMVSIMASPLGINFAQNAAAEMQFITLISEMRNMEGNHLLIIDNANNNYELIDEQEKLRSTGWKILITTRCNPDEYESMPVDELPEDDARKLFKHHYHQDDVDQVLLKEILIRINRHTLLTELLAKSSRKKGLTLKQINDKLQTAEGIKTEDLQRMINVGGHAEGKDLEKTATLYKYILSMFEPEKMDGEYQQILRVFAILPADDIPLVHLKRIFAVNSEGENEFEDQLDSLFQEGWLNRKTESGKQGDTISYKMHALVQDVVLEKLKPDEENCGFVIDALSEIMQGHLTISWDYITYAQAVAVKIVPSTKRLGLLNCFLSDTYKEIGKLEAALALMENAVEIFKRCDDKSNLAVSYSHLGDIHQALGSFDKALTFIELRAKLGKELYEENPKNESLKNGLAISYERLGDIYQALGSFDKALEFYELDISLTKELYEANPKSESLKVGLAISYEKLGDIHQAQGSFDKALEFYGLDISLTEELYEANQKSESLKSNLAISYGRLGSVHQAQGSYNQALAFFVLYNNLIKELYAANSKSESLKNGLAISYSKLGGIHQAQGSYDQALEFFELRAKLSKELYEANPESIKLKYGLAVSYHNLAGIYGEENKAVSKEYYKKSLILLDQLYGQTKIDKYKEFAEGVKTLI